MALSITTPRIMARGWSHIRLKPTRRPRNRLLESEPLPRVMALWSQPGPLSLVYIHSRLSRGLCSMP